VDSLVARNMRFLSSHPLLGITINYISSPLTWSPYYLLKSTNHKAPHNAVFSSLLLTYEYSPQHPVFKQPQSMPFP